MDTVTPLPSLVVMVYASAMDLLPFDSGFTIFSSDTIYPSLEDI